MNPLIAFFKANEVIVYSIYGQVFFTMGVAIAVLSIQHSRLHMVRYLWLLAAFGLSHGLVEWGYVFIPIQATYMPVAFVEGLYILQFLLLAVSFICLLSFGAGLAFRSDKGRQRWVVGLPVTAWLVAFSASVLARDGEFLLRGEVWARYLLAVPACVFTGYGLWLQAAAVKAMNLSHISRDLRIAGSAMWVYGVFSGLVTPAYNSLPMARWINHDVVFAVIGLPIPIVRSLAAVTMAYAIIRSLDVFRVETERLLQEARDQKLMVAQRELEALSAIGVAVGQSRELDTVLRNGLQRVLQILRLEQGAVLLTSGQPPEVTSALCTCGGATSGKGADCHWCQQLAREMLAAGEPVKLREMADGAHGLGIALTAGGATLGAMALYSPRPLELTPEARLLLTSIGTQIGVAVENARLWEEVRQKEAVREQLLQRIITAQEEERKRIARELHDDTGQVLTALVIQLGAAAEALPPGAERARGFLDQAAMRLKQALQDIRKLISDLRPTLLDDLGLVPALRRYLESTGAGHGMRMRLRTERLPARLPSHLETALFRIVQEGVTNAVKHAEASDVSVVLALEDGHVVARVEDNGRGFDVSKLARPQATEGFGLTGIRERVALLGGTVESRSEPREGTRLVARIPLPGEVAAHG